MRKKEILWVSRHPLWRVQKALLKSLHGKGSQIKELNIRFQGYDHFLDFLEENQDKYHIYTVVPQKWKEKARELGFAIGTIHRPKNIKNQGKRRRIFHIEFHIGIVIKEKTLCKSYNTKGYH